MGTSTNAVRQGLPRIPGGEPWPPADLLAVVPVEPAPAASQASSVPANTPAPALEAPPVQVPVEPALPAVPAASALPGILRRGLPRLPGGEPWPPGGAAPAAPVASAPAAAVPAEVDAESAIHPAASAAPVASVASDKVEIEPAAAAATGRPLRRGLPRTANGQPWPPAATVSASAQASPRPTAPAQPAAAAARPEVPATPVSPPAPAAPAAPAAPVQPAAAASVTERVAAPAAAPAQAASAPSQSHAAPASPAAVPQPRKPLTAASTPARPAAAAPAAAKPKKAEPKRHGPLTTKQWVLAGVLGAFCALGVATAVVLLARWIVGFEAISNFVARYPGEYHLPESAPVGVPKWLAWNHFFNFFLMVLIIRSGLQVRHQRKPPAYWSSKRSPKVSINLWLHQSLDLLWLVNGLVFVVLLFATGHWMRIVPTSWEVFPHAVSAALQYMTLDWPTENGWVNYNALQQLAYFLTVFIAAPLAAITGFRLSAFWPKNATALTKRYPIEVARALHFPTMLYFSLFIVVHVALVLSTGALRNLNHMFAAQGSTDPTQFASNWTGLWMFAVSILATAVAWFACRPMILASIARIFGKVSAR